MVKVVRNIIVIVLLGLAVYFGYLAYVEYQPLIRSKAQQEAIREVAVVDTDDPYNRVIDFDALKSINKDIVGWLYIPDTSVDYPILIGDTDEEYLYKDMEGKWSQLGSIFSYSDTNRSLSDGVTFLFGHNMLEYQMFGELRRYEEEEFRGKHTKMYVYTENRTMEVAVYSIFTCLDTDDIFSSVGMELATSDYQDLLVELENRNQYDDLGVDDVSSKYNNRTFSLVTCKGDVGTVYRLVINGLVEREKYIIN